MDDWQARTRLLVGDEAADKLQSAHVAVFGLGGVGGYCAEALARAGVGELTLVDNDVVSDTNRNRQILALRSTLGQYKVDACAARLRDISPDIALHPYGLFFNEETALNLDFYAFDYIADAVDTVTSKLLLIKRASDAGVPIVCCMGTGNKLDPSRLRATPLEQTDVCPLARVMRAQCRKRGLTGVTAVWSDEPPCSVGAPMAEHGRHAPASAAFVPGAAGLLMASVIVRNIIGKQ